MPDFPAHRISSEQNASLRVGDLAGRRRLRFSFFITDSRRAFPIHFGRAFGTSGAFKAWGL